MALALRLSQPLVRQALRFGIVGVANTFTCLALVWTLEGQAGMAVWLASAIGYGVGIVQSYVLNRFWTFGAEPSTPVGAQFLRFLGVNIVVGAVFSATTTLLAPPLGVRMATIVALVPVTLMSFIGMRHLVFSQRS